MSRLHVTIFMTAIFTTAAYPQQSATDEEIATQIERARRLVAADEEGCVKYPQNDEIVVCGENRDNASQRIFRDYGEPDENRIRHSEAVPTKRAAACLPGDNMCLIPHNGKGIGFGYVPPVAIALEEILGGLPEPDMVVNDGKPETP